ncbi:MAG: hypothetical protein ACM3UY_03170 [Methanocella sp.]
MVIVMPYWDFQKQKENREILSMLKALLKQNLSRRELVVEAQVHKNVVAKLVPVLLSKRLIINLAPKTRRRGQALELSITRKGRVFLANGTKLMELAKVFFDGFQASFETAYDSGRTEEYCRFLEQLEPPLREFLNQELVIGEPSSIEFQLVFHDPMLTIHDIDVNWLLEDAAQARARNNYLTYNHRYILNRVLGLPIKLLIDHNVGWKNRVESYNFTGKETAEELKELLDPYSIVRKEAEARQSILVHKETRPYIILSSHNQYEGNATDWKVDVQELVRNYHRASSSLHRTHP